MILRVIPEIFPGCHPEKIQVLKKRGFAEPDIFLGFEINLALSNQKSECRLKSRLTTNVDKGGTLGALM